MKHITDFYIPDFQILKFYGLDNIPEKAAKVYKNPVG